MQTPQNRIELARQRSAAMQNYVRMVLSPQDELLRAAMLEYERTLFADAMPIAA